MCFFIVWYSIEFSRSHNLQSWCWDSRLYGVISSGENSAHFLQLMPLTILLFFVPPGTHHCWLDRGGMIWEACPTPLHMASSVTRAPVINSSTNLARRCLTSVIWFELITHTTMCYQPSNWLCSTVHISYILKIDINVFRKLWIF